MWLILNAVIGGGALTVQLAPPPPWDFVPVNRKTECYSVGADTRWVFSAIPSTPEPDGGYPVYVSLVTVSSPGCRYFRGR